MKDEKMELDFHLPPRDKNIIAFRGAAETTVVANLFRMDLDPNVTIHKYRVDITKITKDKEFDITKGIKTDVASQHRRRVCRSIFEDAVKLAEKNGSPWVDDKYQYVYDCANILYSSKLLNCFNGAPDGPFAIQLTLGDVQSSFSKNFLGTRCEAVIVKIIPTLQFAYSTATNTLENHRETQQFLEVLTSALLYKNGDHFAFGNKFYGKSSRNDVNIGEGKCIKSGFEKNVRIGDDHGAPYALVQIDAKKSPFFNGKDVITFSMDFLGSRYEDALEKMDSGTQRRLSEQLKGLVVKTTHTGKDKARYVYISGLSKERVKDVCFKADDQETDMIDFFKTKYNYPLKYTRTPCVTEKGRKNISLYPMEVLEIERGQRVNCQKASRNLGEKQIQECRLNPADLKEYIHNALDECLLDSKNRYLTNFKVRVSNGWEHVAATILFPPSIRYGKQQAVEPMRDGTLNWKLGNREAFIKPGTVSKMIFIIFDRCAMQNDVNYFLDKFLKTAGEHGMNVPYSRQDVDVVELRSEDLDRLRGAFEHMTKEKDGYIMCLTKQKFDPVHDVMKSLEAKYGVVTQHLCEQTFKKALGNQGAFLVINNLIFKMNQKARGVCHSVALSRVFLENNKTTYDVSKHVFAPNRMIIGFDVSHAGPQSFSERALGQKQSEPSVVGMSFSIGMPTELAGAYWFQEPRFAGISGIDKQVAKALMYRQSQTKSLPDDIIVYRGGVSEGEFDKVVQEIEELKKSFALVGGPGYQPSITAIVVLANSNYRVLPEKIDRHAKVFAQNVYPGTVVSSTVTNPHYNEFILVAQKGIMGTVRPTRCVLVTSDRGTTGVCINCEEAQQLTYALAYGHQVVTASTSLPVPLTAATNLSKRGRNNWKENNYADSDARSALSGGSGDNGQYKHDGTEEFFEKLSELLDSKLKHHFWA